MDTRDDTERFILSAQALTGAVPAHRHLEREDGSTGGPSNHEERIRNIRRGLFAAVNGGGALLAATCSPMWTIATLLVGHAVWERGTRDGIKSEAHNLHLPTLAVTSLALVGGALAAGMNPEIAKPRPPDQSYAQHVVEVYKGQGSVTNADLIVAANGASFLVIGAGVALARSRRRNDS